MNVLFIFVLCLFLPLSLMLALGHSGLAEKLALIIFLILIVGTLYSLICGKVKE